MDSVLTVFLSLRRVFGFLIPGFSWLVLLWLRWPNLVFNVIDPIRDIPGESVLIAAVALLASYLMGAALTVWAFRALEIFGDWIDRVAKRLSSGRARSVITFLQVRLHLVNPCTLEEEMANRLPRLDEDPLRGTGATDAVGIAQWDVYKMYLLQVSPSLGREDLEIEADINLHAGMFLPSLAVAFWLLASSQLLLGAGFVLVSVVMALRFQNLRHHEIIFVAQAYHVLRIQQRER